MVKIVELEKGIYVAPQLTEADFAKIAALGFRAVVDNRPDGEAEDQLPSAKAAEAAARHGLTFRYEPVRNADVTDDAPVSAFSRSMKELDGPVLFYCRSGTRCTTLWAQASVERLGVEETLKIAADAGYDLSSVRWILEDRIEAVAA